MLPFSLGAALTGGCAVGELRAGFLPCGVCEGSKRLIGLEGGSLFGGGGGGGGAEGGVVCAVRYSRAELLGGGGGGFGGSMEPAKRRFRGKKVIRVGEERAFFGR